MSGKKGVVPTAEHRAKISASLKRGAFLACQHCGSEFWRKPNQIHKGEAKFCSRKCYLDWQVGRPKSEAFKIFCRTRKAHANPNWKGGITPERSAIRKSQEYIAWRFAVLNRDGDKCVKCGATKRDTSLHAHHVKPFAQFPDLRLSVYNGLTLCKKCHYQEHANAD